eukprot:TRINITY_DN44151_c0_g1_i1.p1 TRINITY_DN44151_c0_g1~~TRINITY_DN44151_c0_g1_i1.p1  ORF type:complete len:1023 (+),score=200.07 TRINITY_DN44151_c0_g1_i1:127-3195(+)
MSGGHLSKDFFELVKSIGESRSKQEEDKIIVLEIAVLKANLNQPNISARKMKEFMIRAVYVEMLGHDASFAYIHAVKLTHEKNLFAKRIGYLTCNLFLHKDHELMLLLINTMQRDLQSANHLEVCAALTSVCRLVNLEMIPAISPLVFKLLAHAQDTVRKKAVIAVHRFYKLVPEAVLDHKDAVRKVLCDQDPSVMGASLHILFEMTKVNPSGCKDLVPSFVNILKQITEHRLPRDFDYHRMPAPWLQVKLLSILGILGTADQKSSEQMYEVLQECMRRADSGVNIGYAIIYECVKCITRIYPDRPLLELAAAKISAFISSDSHNLKYLGVTGLAQIVQVNASYAADHQMVVVDCLEDPDETLKRKTLDLLYRMTNPQNVIVVVDKLTFALRTSVDLHLRREMVQRITSLAERFAPNNEWYVTTMNSVFELGGDLVPPETAYNLMRLVAEGTGEDDSADHAFRTFAVNTYLQLLEKPTLPDVLLQVIGWVLGEYAKLSTVDGYTLQDVIDLLCETIERPVEDSCTRGYIVTAITKLVGSIGTKSSTVDNVVKTYRSSRFTDLQQRCYEFEQLSQTPTLMRKVLPYDASCEEIDVKKSLSFLDDFVKTKVAEGAKPYQSPSERAASKYSLTAAGSPEPELAKPSLNFTPYTAPSKPTPGSFSQSQGPDTSTGGPTSGGGDGYPTSSIAEKPAGLTGLNVGGRTWGPTGYGGGPPAERPVEKPVERPAPPTPESSNTFGQNSRPPTLASVKAAEKDEAMSEKQKMAGLLFSGLGGGSTTSAPASQKKPTFTQPQPPTVPTQPPPAQAPAAAPAPAPAPAALAAPAAPAPPAPAGDMLDLLDLDGSSGVATAQQPPPPPPAPAASGGGGDLLDMGSFGEGASPTVSVPSQPASPLGLMGQTAAAPVGMSPTPAPAFAAGGMLAPLQVSTAQVGSAWGQLPSERRVAIRTSIASCEDFMRRLCATLNVHPVEIIGSEGIAAASVLPGNDPCFFHGKFAPGRLDLLVRTRDAGVAQRMCEICSQALV